MCTTGIVLFSALIITASSGEVDDTDQLDDHHVNINEIFSNSIALLSDDPLTSLNKDDDLHLPPSQYAEFRLASYTTKSTTPPTTTQATTTTPPPRFIKPSYLRNDETTSTDNPSSTIPSTQKNVTTTSTTTSSKTSAASTPRNDVVPLKNYQRGVLDLILPASRVKNFKDVFESVRRLLSYTF